MIDADLPDMPAICSPGRIPAGQPATATAVIARPGGSRRAGYTLGMTEMTTIKVSAQTRDRLKKLADEDHLTMDAELTQALDKVEEARFWEGVQTDYARLQADPKEWSSYVRELAEWDEAAGDGLDTE